MLFSFENIHRQYLRCRRNKRNTANALRFEADQERELFSLQEELMGRTYRPSRSVCFFAARPKLREIFAAGFRDRIVHHVLVDYLETIWEPIFIHDSYACRKGKGIHRAVARLQQFIRQVTANGSRRAWYLQLDIKNYFMTLDKAILFAMIRAKCPDPDALWLSERLIFHDCTENPLMRGDPRLKDRLPPHKTLFHAPKGKGLPIGNLNSQFFANVYLNSLDQFVKHTVKCRHYLRYCDDFVLLAESREQLLAWESEIAAFLSTRLALELNQNQRRLRPVSDGVNFLGYIVRADYLLVRRRVAGNLTSKLASFEKQLVAKGDGWVEYRFERQMVEALAATLASYLGHCRHANSRRLISELWRRFPFLSRYGKLAADGPLAFTRRDMTASGLGTVRRQYAYFQRRFPEGLFFMQVGRFFELYGGASRKAAAILGLAPLQANRRGARYGFPARLLNRYWQDALAAGLSVEVALEERPLAGIKVRRLWRRYEGVCG